MGHALRGRIAPGSSSRRSIRSCSVVGGSRVWSCSQASDWQFMISTGAVPDYAERRFNLHCGDAERLVAALASAASGGGEGGAALAAELERRDALFPNVLETVAEVLAG